MRSIKIFDTTLRDGEQAPGFSMKIDEKIAMALQLEKLGVDIIEAGFPVTSPGDFEAVQKISEVIKNSSVAGLTRANKNDIAVTWKALEKATKPRIHIVLATSDIHLEYKLKKTRDQVLAMAIDAVSYASTLCEDIEFSGEDAARSNKDFLCTVIEAVIKAGAKTVNIPDTVGYTSPEEYFELITYVRKNVPNINDAVISVHCHNDLGLATANSLAAIRAGAGQVECAINGIGERAGNAALEEIVMALNVRKDIYNTTCKINTKEIYKTSRLLSNITGIRCQPNKAIVGKNVFSHESGIHQDGVLKNPFTYEIMTPESVGFSKSTIVLGKHSGRNAFNTRMTDIGYKLNQNELDKLFTDFKVLADKKNDIYDEDLHALFYNYNIDDNGYKLDYVCISTGNKHIPTATVILTDRDGNTITDASTGDGAVDAAFKAIERITNTPCRLLDYKINAVTSGKDAQGEVIIKVIFDDDLKLTGRGYSTDVLVASVLAYINAFNKYILMDKINIARKTNTTEL